MKENSRENYITEQEAIQFRNLFSRYLKEYREKNSAISDEEWLRELFKKEITDISLDEAKTNAEQIVKAVHVFDDNLKSVNDAAVQGISKERWLAGTLEEACIGMSVNQYGQILQSMEDVLYEKNIELSEALKRASDGHIKMSPNLDGNIAENMIAKTTELSGVLQGKKIKVEVRDVFTENSVDVRAINLDTGKYKNYQLKFGKDAKATIQLIERGNYNNQQIIVPSEQLEEVQAHFKAKGSSKTISDHIEVWGAKGRSFTKQDMKELQIVAQEDGIMPTMDYSHYQTKDLALSIGKNAGVLALQNIAVMTGINLAMKVCRGEKLESDEMIETALRTGADTSIKIVTAGTLQVAIRKGMIALIPKATPAGAIANIACVGIENAKILLKIASGELSLTKGIDSMGRVSVSMIGGLVGMAKGATMGAALTGWIPVLGIPLSITTGFVGGMVGYFAGSKVGEAVHSTAKKVANAVKGIAKAGVNSLKKVGGTIKRRAKALGKKIFG